MYLIYTTQKNGEIIINNTENENENEKNNHLSTDSVNYDSEYEVNAIIDQINKDL
jgi:hypothetical protein